MAERDRRDIVLLAAFSADSSDLVRSLVLDRLIGERDEMTPPKTEI